ncbi:uncharacterized protein LOC114321700 [Camellia sinensis]|uniref:uncharacterized protein LOC114321700 n=1 Tax=Camellia sinensis TaxID=4442 RepID=UPI0010356E54|nr:uncharacterized protein LOC114321700 [Camellia sinensis]
MGPTHVTCFRCGQQGHKVAKCKQNPGHQQQTHSQSKAQGRGQLPTCYHCKQSGHMKRSCPQLVMIRSASRSQSFGSYQEGQGQRQNYQSVQSRQTLRAVQRAASTQLTQPTNVLTGDQDVGFDVILGMDWLSSYRAIIDCYRGRVTVCTARGDYFYFLGNRADEGLLPLYDPQSRGKLSFLLATIVDDKSNTIREIFPKVVCEYPTVFPEDLTELPHYRVVEFSIDLVPGATPISMLPYRFALAELLVLKEQLQELLDKGVIRPSTSP